MDTLTQEKRSSIMAAIKNKNTGPEMLVRRYLWAQGIRFRLHAKQLPGKPDIVINRHKIAIFIHGCFWHGHDRCARGQLPKSRITYWKIKITANRERDRAIEKSLRDLGWRVLTIWECQLRTKKAAAITLPHIRKCIIEMQSEFNE